MTAVFLINGSTNPWPTPGNWNNNDNEVECYGPGGNGASGTTGSSGNGGGGGGGGGWVGRSNLTLSGDNFFRVPLGGSATSTRFANDGTNGGANWFGATAGGNASGVTQGNGGGVETNGTPPGTAYLNTAGGAGGSSGKNLGGGGGGACGGGLDSGANGGTPGGTGGGGGGGCNSAAGGGAGAAGAGGDGGNGINGTTGSPGGTGGAAGAAHPGGGGTLGGGGGGSGGSSTAADPGAGGPGAQDASADSTHGSGSGGGGCGGCSNSSARNFASGDGAEYGGGGGGRGYARGSRASDTGGTGGDGLIAIFYTVANSGVTVLLLHMDGADASTTFTDSSISGAGSPHTVTANGNAQLDTATQKFGTASGLFDGTGDYLSLDTPGDFTFGYDPFTIDFWCRKADVGVEEFLYDGREASTGTGSQVVQLKWDGSNVLAWQVQTAAGPKGLNGTTTVTADGAFHHVALTRDAGMRVRMFLDGTQEGSTFHLIFALEATVNPHPIIGSEFSTLAKFFNGWLDEFRVVKGEAKWIANFTPPTAPYSLVDTLWAQILL